jgi:glycine/D-amino acid oxidase-like deaminating enzyme
MYDFLIVGQGIAGTTLAHQLIQKQLKVCVIDNNPSSSSSQIASGLYNPVVLKRMKKVWHADFMLETLLPYYQNIEERIDRMIIDSNQVRRIFNTPEEQNNWHTLVEDPNFKELLAKGIEENNNNTIAAPFALGRVLQSGRIKVKEYLKGSKNYFIEQHAYKEDEILYHEIHAENDSISWKKFHAKHIIFCEGHQARFNPWFSYLPFACTKGEVMTVRSEANIKHPLNGGKFILPLGDDEYKVGATYNWDELNEQTTEEGLNQLKDGWSKISSSTFELKQHSAGIRPNTKDRRPFLGTHPDHPNVHIFNGLGSRGILMAPYLAQCMVNYLLNHDYLHPEMDISRFNED